MSESIARRCRVRITDRVNPGEASVVLVLRSAGDGGLAAALDRGGPGYSFRRRRFGPAAAAIMGVKVLTRLARELHVTADSLDETRRQVAEAEAAAEVLTQDLDLTPEQERELARSGWAVTPLLPASALDRLKVAELEAMAAAGGVEVRGTGVEGNVLKGDLVRALAVPEETPAIEASAEEQVAPPVAPSEETAPDGAGATETEGGE